MKKTTKRALSFLLTLVMLVSTMSVGFFGITSLAATNATVDSTHQAVIAVPETVYMTPSTGASTTGQYYVNNTISGGNTFTVVPEASNSNTKGYVQLYIPGAKSVTYTASYCSGTNVGDVVASGEGTEKTFTNGYLGLNETTISVGTGLTSGQTSLVEWVFTVKMNDGSTRVYYAYSTLYAPYYQPVGAAAEAFSGKGISSSQQAWLGSIAWVSGVHSFTTSNYSGASAKNPNTSWFLPMMGTVNVVNNTRPYKSGSSHWLLDSPGAPDKTVTFLENDGSNHRRVNVVSPLGKMTVDTSRYSNFNQIPNFKVGYMITDSENSDNGKWYVADYTGYNYAGSKDGNDLGSYGNGGSEKDRREEYYNAPHGTTIATSENKDCAVKYHGVWNKDIATGTLTIKAAAGVNETGGTVKRSAWNNLFIQIDVTGANKASLRSEVLAGTSLNANNYTSATWNDYITVLRAAAQRLGDPTVTNVDTSALETEKAALQTTVTLNANGGSIGTTSFNQTVGAASTYNYSVSSYTPTRANYTFKGWSTDKNATSGSTTSVNAGLMPTLYAIWEINKYTVTWDVDGTKTTETYTHGSTPSYKNGTPTKASDGKYEYTFTGWSPSLSAVTSDITYTAQFSAKSIGHTITWKVEGQDDVTTVVGNGETPEYPNGTPTKASTAEYSYTFTGWSPAVNAATGDATYTAQFEAKKRSYTITWLNEDGTTIDTTTVEYGKVPTHADPTKASTDEFSYEFTGWTPAVVAVTGNATYTATFKGNTRSYTVTWLDYDGSVIKDAEKVAYGTTPTAPADPVRNSSAQYDYTFAGWTPKVDKITGDTTYTATYTESLRSYTITWVIDGNTETTTVKYGDVPTHANPTKAETDAYTYEFTGWDTTPVAVTGEATYTAQFKATKKSYTITWVIDGKSETTSVEYGEMPTHADPTKASTPEFSYTFTGWSPAIKAVDGEATYTAQFKEAKRSYTITFVNYDDEVLYSADFEYGTTPEYKGETPVKEGNAQYSYVFTGWGEIKAVTGTATYKAQFEESTNVYTVTWENYDGSLLETDENVPYGTTPKYDGATPVKPSTDKYEYVFENVWTPAVDEVTGDVTYTAQFTEKVRKYTVSWKNSDGTSIYTEEVEYGTVPVYDEATYGTPSKAATDKYTYTFKDWGEIVPVTGNVVYIAQFDSTVNKYTITWKNGDDVLKTEKVAYDELPVYDGTTPSKAADAQYTYTFAGWTPEVVTVTGDATYSAKYDTTLKTYTVTWINENGAVLETDTEVPYGTTPEYNGTTPAKDATDEFTYTFDKWSPEIVAVTCDATYTATYTAEKNAYTITWIIDGKTETTRVEYGEMPTHENPTKAETDAYTYEFTGWTPTIENVTGEATYTAQFEATKKSYTITWKNDDGSVIDRTTVEYGETPSHSDAAKENTAEYTYTFAGWTPSVVAVTGDATYTATYTAKKNSYKITWKNDDGSVIDTTTVEYGETPTHSDPTKAATAEYTYTFAGWTPAVVSVTGDAEYTATYTAKKNSYTITWLNEDGTEIDTTSVEYGEVPTHAAPTKANTAEYTYTFAGWTPDVAAVTGEATYKAVFTATKNKYTVKWVDENGSEIRTDSNVEYGTAITAPANPTKAQDAQYTYTFAGWTPAVSSTVTGNVTYTATYAGTLRSYAIKWEVNNEVVKTDIVEYGQTPVYDGAEPTKAATAQYTYKFKGWTPVIEAVTGEKTYVAEFDAIVNEYTITFENYDGTELQSTKVPYGTVPAHNGNTPVKTAEGYTYTFKGWTPAIEAVTGDKTYTAEFTETVNVYTITWVGYESTVTTEVKYGEAIVAPAVPVKEGFIGVWVLNYTTMPATDLTVNAQYVKDGITVNWVIETDTTVTHQTAVRRNEKITPDSAWAKDVLTVSTVYTFKGWSETKNGAIIADSEWPTVTESDSVSKTYYAVFEESAREYTITWKNDDGSVIDTTKVAYGTVPTHANATKAADAQYTYTFDKWSPELVEVTGDATYTATYKSVVNYYTVTWIVEGQTVIKEVAYGDVPSYSSEPTKAATAQYTYTFAGWSPAVSAVTGNATYTATFNSTINKYTVTWVDEDGTTILETDTGVEYGTKPSFDKAEPTKAATAQYTYTFAGWAGLTNETTVTGDVTFKATYTSTVNKYTVEFVNEDGTVLQSEELEYGATPEYNGTAPTKAATAQYTFTFAGWDKTIAEVTGNVTYKATYTSTVNNYTVTWIIDGATETQTYAYGATPSHEEPSKTGNAQYTYKFTGWTPAIETVTGNATYTAQFSETVNTYTVTWIIDGNTETQTYAYGATPVHADPTKAADAQYTYTFAGWDKEIVTVTGDVTYTAEFNKTVNKYTVTWSIDGNTETQTYEYGATPSHADPVKAADAQYTYTFAGWDKTITTVTGDVTYTAKFDKTVNKYTITWKNGDDVLKTEQVAYGSTPSYVGETPVKTGDAQYSYVFAGWTPAVVSVTGDATYTAAFTPVTNKYTVTWVVEGKTVETDENVEYGSTPKYDGAVPTKKGNAQYSYTFAGWEPTVSNVEGNVVYTATFTQTVNEYTVKFVNEDGTVLQSGKLAYGATPEYKGTAPTKAATAQYTFTFAGWNNAIATVTGDVTYKATYTSTVNEYTIKFVNEDGTVLQSGKVAYGETPVYTGAEPSKAATAQYTFTFADWDKTIAKVTGDATYKATYTSTVNKYTITWIVNGKSTTEQVAYGTVPSFNGSTDKAPSNTTVYTFAGWDNEPVKVTGPATYTATYTEAVRLYTITWVVNGTSTTEQYKYNELPSFKGSTDIPETPAATYVFKGWSPAIKAVTGDATYTAEYDVTVRGFVITWIVDGVKTTEVVEYGKVPVFAGSTDKAPTATETFTFAGWDKTPVAATEDTTYTATYTSAARKYTVEWVVDGVVVKTEKLAYNSVIPVPGLPADKEGYTVKWDNTISIMPASDITIEAIYTPRMYPVYWIVDGTTVYSASVPFGTAIPEKAVPAKEGHTGKWLNVPATMPAGIVMIEAQYTARTYQVFWKIGDTQSTESATYGIDYVVTFSGVNAPEDLRITVGGVVLTADKYEYNSETGTLKIAGNAITGNINIIAKSTSGSVSVVNSIFGGASLNSNSVIDIRTTYHATITPDAGYVLPKTIAIYVDGILITEGYVYDSTTGKLTINAEVIVGDIEIYAECEEDPTYDATGECTCSCHSKNSLVAFFFKIFTFLRKLFGMSQYQYCGCGAAHW